MHFISMHENTFYLDAFWKHFFCRLGPVAVTNGACTHCMSCHRRAGVTLKKTGPWLDLNIHAKIPKRHEKNKQWLSFISTILRWRICMFVYSASRFLSPNLYSRVHPFSFSPSIHPSLLFLFKCVCLYFPISALYLALAVGAQGAVTEVSGVIIRLIP